MCHLSAFILLLTTIGFSSSVLADEPEKTNHVIEDVQGMIPYQGELLGGYDYLFSVERTDGIKMVISDVLKLPTTNPIKVCFIDKVNQPFQRRVVNYIKDWEIEGSKIKFDAKSGFGLVHQCQGNEAIRITLAGSTLSADIGKSSIHTPPKMATVRLGGLTGLSEKEQKKWTLHEIGHALGLLHEHQTQESGCIDDLNTKKLAAYLENQKNWNKTKIEENISTYRTQRLEKLKKSETDFKSIMMYSFPRQFYRDGSKCRDINNYELSSVDKSYVKQHYWKSVDGLESSWQLYAKSLHIPLDDLDENIVKKQAIINLLQEEFKKNNPSKEIKEQIMAIVDLYTK